MEYAVRIKNISKTYALYNKPSDRLKEAFAIGQKWKNKYHRNFEALKPVTVDIEKGKCFGIIGVNGSGKSTLLKMVTGVLTPTTGDIEVNGRVSALLELGAGFNQEFTGLENIYLNGTIMGYSKEEMKSKIPAIEEFADIGDFIYQPVKTYSSGMFARLAFAVAINVDPDILIVDEALSVGDIYFQAKCFNKFDEFKSKGKTIIFVTHDMGSVFKYCDEVMLLHKGSMADIGKPGEMIDRFKKILANTIENEQVEEKIKEVVEDNKTFELPNWQSKMALNPRPNIYGDMSAQIIDFGIFDEDGNIGNTIIKEGYFTIKVICKFNETITDPIISYTIKSTKGVELTGTNTFLEGKLLPEVKKGTILLVTFRQKMYLQHGQYLLNLGITKYGKNAIDVFDRHYDCVSLDVIGEKCT